MKSRVMANALSSLVSDSSQVFIMGHKFPDNDAMGAAAGVCALCRKNGVPAHIIREPGSTPSQELTDKGASAGAHGEIFGVQHDAGQQGLRLGPEEVVGLHDVLEQPPPPADRLPGSRWSR